MDKKLFFTPGPSQLFFSFEYHFKRAIFKDIPSVSHRSKKFSKILQGTTEALVNLLKLPKEYDILYVNSANEAWDRMIQNLVIHSSHHFINGAFSKKFYDFALSYNMSSTKTQVEDGQHFKDFSIPEKCELIGITKNETSVGYSFTESEIAKLRKNNPHLILALDVVSSAPVLLTDFSQIDTAYFSVQKCFGMPPGLCVWIVNEKCLEKAQKKNEITSLGSYRALPNLKKFAVKHQTPETPNTLFIYLLGKIAEDMLDLGTSKIERDTFEKATLIKNTINDHLSFQNFVNSTQHQSNSTIVFKAENSSKIIDKLKNENMYVGTGYGKYNDQHIRIANFPTHSKECIEKLCDWLKKDLE